MSAAAWNANRDPALPRRARRSAAPPAADVPVLQTDGPAPEPVGRSGFFDRVPRPRFARVPREAASVEGPAADVPVPQSDEHVKPEPSGRLRFLRSLPRPRFRAPREAADADWVPVHYRVARAVGTAASALPESRAVRVGTVVVTAVAANPGIVRAGLTAASAIPVLRPYVKVAVVATTAITAARRIAEAKRATADVVSAFRARPEDGNGSGPAAAAPAKAASEAEPPPSARAEPEAAERATDPEESAGR